MKLIKKKKLATAFIFSILMLIFVFFYSIYFQEKENDVFSKQSNQHFLVSPDSSIEFYKPLYENTKYIKIYVSKKGNDMALGNIKYPLATIDKARDIIRLLKRLKYNYYKNYSVIISEGHYFRSDPFLLDSTDSGSENYRVTYQGEEGKIVVFSGGIQITNDNVKRATNNSPAWERLNPEVKDKIFTIDLKKQNIFDYGNESRRGFALPLIASPLELYINNQSMTVARWPNEGFSIVNEVIDSLIFTIDNTRLKNWINEPNAWAMGFWQWGWAEYFLPIQQIDTTNNSIHLGLKPRPKHDLKKGSQWYAYNILEELDTPGEYYIDNKTGWLYFIPPLDCKNAKMQIEVSIAGNKNDPIIKIENANHITIQNLAFEKTRGAGINIVKGNSISIKDCIIQNTGTYAIKIDGVNCKLSNLHVFDIGAFGIQMFGGDRKKLIKSNNIIENCLLHNISRRYPSHNPMIELYGVGHTVKNCEMYNSPGIAIRFEGNYHMIEKNNIHNVCLILDDTGAINCGRDWALGGNVIRYNLIHHLTGSKHVQYKKGINGIYLDDCGSGITVFGNILYKIRTWGIVSGGGRYNIIKNNIVVKSRAAIYTDRRGHNETHTDYLYNNLKELKVDRPPWSYTFPEVAEMLDGFPRIETSLVKAFRFESIATRFPKFANAISLGYDTNLDPVGCIIENNIGWGNRGWKFESKFGKGGGFKFFIMKNNLEDVDPHFIDANNLNFDLKDDSPAYSLPGFERIPYEQIGLLNKESILY